MNIAVIGTGNVGGALGRRWAQAGHDVSFGVRDPQKDRVQTLVSELGGKARAINVHEAARRADVVVFATPWGGTEDAIKSAGDLSGKIVIDCTNPLAPDMSPSIGHTTSAGEQVAAWAVGARVAKAFNSVGSRVMANTDFGDEQPSMFVCSDDADAKQVAMQLAADIGFEPIDCGPLRIARYLEPLASLWIHLAYGMKLGGDKIAWRLIRRESPGRG